MLLPLSKPSDEATTYLVCCQKTMVGMDFGTMIFFAWSLVPHLVRLVYSSHMQGGIASTGLDVGIHGVACHAVHIKYQGKENIIVML